MLPSILIFIWLPVSIFALDFRSHAYKKIPDIPTTGNGLGFNSNFNPYEQFTNPSPINGFQFTPVPKFENSIVGQVIGATEPPGIVSFPIAGLEPNFTQPLAVFQPTVWKTPLSQYSNVYVSPSSFGPFTYTTPPTYRTMPTTTTKKPTKQTPATPTPVIWTTTKSSKIPAKMSRLNAKPVKKEEGGAAHISVPSHRLLNDILVIPSSRRVYILAILPIHESADNQGFECGRVDVNGFIRLGAFLDALNKVNSQRVLKDAGLSLGAVIVDSCSSDLRTVADLYELLSGTNIQKSDLVAMIRDDGSHLPNVDDFARHLKIPVINTFFTTGENALTTGTLPSMASPIEAMLALLSHTGSSCVSLIYDDLHSTSSQHLAEIAISQGICLEHSIQWKGEEHSLAVVRRLLLTEARIAVVLLSEGNWIQLMKAFQAEMVIAGRFILLTTQEPRWFTSKQFLEMWPHFDQLLMSVAVNKPHQSHELTELAKKFPQFPFPQHWLRQFWSTAFRCHVDGEMEREQFSKDCGDKQLLNLTAVAPDIDVAPVTLAVHTVAHAVRRLVDNVCPGALVQILSDCLNDPQESLFGSILTTTFDHHLSHGIVNFNGTSTFRDVPLVVNRVMYDAQLIVEKIAEWDTVTGFAYTAGNELVMEERDGSRVPLSSKCPRSACAAEIARRSQAGARPLFRESLGSVSLLIYTICAVMAFFAGMMCMYHQIVTQKADVYRVCTVFTFGGLAVLCLISVVFVMPPNVVSCSLRRILFAPVLSAVFAPILVKTLAIWRIELTSSDPLKARSRTSSTMLFWICVALVLLQIVISIEWAVFENPGEMTFTFSLQHGQGWRCSPGDKFEQNLLHSCGLIGLMIIITLVCSILSAKHVECMQNILISVLSIGFGTALYIALPLVPYKTRDVMIAGALLVFSALIILITYCRGAFARRSRDSTNDSLMDKSSNSEKWLENQVLSPRGQHTLTLQRNYHNVATMDRFANYGAAAPMYGVPRPQVYGSQQMLNNIGFGDVRTMPRATTLGRPQSQHKYGIEGYELPPNSSPPPQQRSMGAGKYGQQEYVLEEDGGHSRL